MVYFAGHATADGIYMLDDNGDSNVFVHYSILFDLFALNNNQLKLLILNACATGDISSLRSFSRNRNVDHVIASQKVITDSEGANFMFYFLYNLFVKESDITASFRNTISQQNLPFSMVPLGNSGRGSSEDDFVEKKISSDEYFDGLKYTPSSSENYIFKKQIYN